MKKLLAALLSGLVLLLPLTSVAAPDEVQRMLTQKAQDAKKKLAAAQTASGVERQKMMLEHMKSMQDITAEMQKAKAGDGMSPVQQREWIDEHLKLMSEMMGQMMAQHHMMSQGAQGTGNSQK